MFCNHPSFALQEVSSAEFSSDSEAGTGCTATSVFPFLHCSFQISPSIVVSQPLHAAWSCLTIPFHPPLTPPPTITIQPPAPFSLLFKPIPLSPLSPSHNCPHCDCSQNVHTHHANRLLQRQVSTLPQSSSRGVCGRRGGGGGDLHSSFVVVAFQQAHISQAHQLVSLRSRPAGCVQRNNRQGWNRS